MCARAGSLAGIGLLTLAVICGSTGGSPAAVALAQPGGERPDGATVWFQGYLADSVTGDPLTGSYSVVAAIYDQASGGVLLWGPETHNATQVLEGWFHIELGSIATPFLDFSTPPYYLQLTVSGEVLAPRQKMASVPAAIRSGDDGDWEMVGDDLYHTSGTVNVGFAPPLTAGREEQEGERSSLSSRQEKGVYAYEENGLAVYGSVTETDNAADWRNGVYGFRTRSVSAPGSSYAAGQTSNGVAGYTVWGDPYTFGVAGYSYNDLTRTGGVIGAKQDGSYWGALGYKDETGTAWGLYTPNNAYVGGTLTATATNADKLDNQHGSYYQDATNLNAGTVAEARLPQNAIDSSEIEDNTIASIDILDGTIASIDIADGTITSADIADGTVTTADIANETITSADILNGTIVSIDILDGTVASVDIADGAVASADITDGTVSSTDIADGAITNADISASAAIADTKISGTAWTHSGDGYPPMADYTGGANFSTSSATWVVVTSLTVNLPTSMLVCASAGAWLDWTTNYSAYIGIGYDSTTSIEYYSLRQASAAAAANSIQTTSASELAAGTHTIYFLAEKGGGADPCLLLRYNLMVQCFDLIAKEGEAEH
jgi:hypothetical protein